MRLTNTEISSDFQVVLVFGIIEQNKRNSRAAKRSIRHARIRINKSTKREAKSRGRVCTKSSGVLTRQLIIALDYFDKSALPSLNIAHINRIRGQEIVYKIWSSLAILTRTADCLSSGSSV
jgi:hypothetical protein